MALISNRRASRHRQLLATQTGDTSPRRGSQPDISGSDCMRRPETIVDVAQQNHARFDGRPIPTRNRSSSSAALRSNWSEWASSPRAPTTPRTVDRAVRSAGSSPAARFPTRGPRTASAPLRGARQPARRRHIAAAERGSARGRPPQARAHQQGTPESTPPERHEAHLTGLR